MSTPAPYPPAGSGDATAIQGFPVLAITPTRGAVLGYGDDGAGGEAWQPAAVTDLLGTVPIENGGTGATDAEEARTNLGLGSAATHAAEDFDAAGAAAAAQAAAEAASLPLHGTADSAVTLSQTLPVNKGGTAGTTAAQARANLGITQRPTAGADVIVLGARRFMTPQGTTGTTAVPLIQLDVSATIDGLIFCAQTAPGVGQTVTATIIKSSDYGATWTDTGTHVELAGALKYGTDNTPISASGAELYALAIDASVGSSAAGCTASFNVKR